MADNNDTNTCFFYGMSLLIQSAPQDPHSSTLTPCPTATLTPYFSFLLGTLMAPGVLHRVIHGTPNPDPWQREYLTVRPGLLYGYQRRRVRWADYPAVIPHEDPNSSVRGTIVSGLTKLDLARLDIFEGLQYDRQTVKVQVLEGLGLDELALEAKDKEGHDKETNKIKDYTIANEASVGVGADAREHVLAQTYVWTDGKGKLEIKEWDFEAFKRDKMTAWMGLADAADDSDAVDVDEGFADVDRFVEEEDDKAKGQNNNAGHDPMGGRGVDGHITRQLFDTAG